MRERYRQILTDVEQFDPRVAGREAALGYADLILPRVREMVGDVVEEGVGRGQLHAGGGMEREQRTLRGGLEHLYGQVATLAPQFSAQYLGAAGLRGELASGDLDRTLLERELRRSRRGGLGGGIGTLLGGIAGSVIPGVGTAVGAGIGGILGRGIGGY